MANLDLNNLDNRPHRENNKNNFQPITVIGQSRVALLTPMPTPTMMG